jgi:YidC/Oxa1 family membrane protein insertase
MEIWHLWTSLLTSSISFMSGYFGVSEAVAIIGLTMIARTGLMPVSVTAALRMDLNKERLRRIKPELETLKARLQDKPSELAAATMRLYKDNGIRFFDRLMLVNIGTQSLFGFGIYQALARAAFKSRFLWIASLAKPDVLLTVVVALIMVVAMSIAPGALAEPTMIIVLCVSVVVTIFAVAAMPSAIGIYWATSNVASVVQSCLLRWLVGRRRVATVA